MTYTRRDQQRDLHHRAMAQIRAGLAAICIDPRTGTLPSKDFDRFGGDFEDAWMSAAEVHEVLEVMAEYVGEAPASLFGGGRGANVAYDAVCLAASLTEAPSLAAA